MFNDEELEKLKGKEVIIPVSLISKNEHDEDIHGKIVGFHKSPDGANFIVLDNGTVINSSLLDKIKIID